MLFFFFNDTATTEIYTLSLHDALPIFGGAFGVKEPFYPEDFLIPYLARQLGRPVKWIEDRRERSEEHTSELQSRQYLVCRLLLEKKKKTRNFYIPYHEIRI